MPMGRGTRWTETCFDCTALCFFKKKNFIVVLPLQRSKGGNKEGRKQTEGRGVNFSALSRVSIKICFLFLTISLLTIANLSGKMKYD